MTSEVKQYLELLIIFYFCVYKYIGLVVSN